MKKKILVITLIVFTIVSCGPKIYTVQNAENYTRNHRTLAILPPKVSIPAQKNMSAAALRENEKSSSLSFQQEMYIWMLKRSQQGKLNVEIQDVDETIALLNKIDYFDKAGGKMTPAELASALGVDAVLSSNYALSKPMSEGAAIAMGVLVGAWGPTAKTKVDLNLYDGKTGKMIWNYNHEVGGTFTSHTKLVDALMKNASKKLPYKK